MSKKYMLDLLERVFWTFAQVAVSLLITESANWDTEYAMPIAAALALIKGYVAHHVGDPESAAILPVDEPASDAPEDGS